MTTDFMELFMNKLSDIFISYFTNKNSIIYNPAIISALVSATVSICIFYLNSNIQKRMALYQNHYKFWLDFSKNYFSVEPFIKHIVNSRKYSCGITLKNNEETKKIYETWLLRWDNFYELVRGNEKIYLANKNIHFLLLDSFFKSVKENIDNLDFTKNNDNYNVYSISPKSISNIIKRAKQLFEYNLYTDKELELQYNKILKNYSNSYIKNNVILTKTTQNERKKIIEDISNEAFIEILENNINDISNKISDIVSIKPFYMILFDKIKKKG